MSHDYWIADRLGRRQDAQFLYNFLIGQVDKRREQGKVASYVVNVDADWGGGKTFFLDGLAHDIESHGHLVARINAWRDDHAEDPYVAIMAAIDKSFEPHIRRPGRIAKAWTAAKSSGGAIALNVSGAVVKGLFKKHVGLDWDQLGELGGQLAEEVVSDAAAAGGEQLEKLFDSTLEAMISGFKRTDSAMADFRSKLEKAIVAVGNKKRSPLFVLVDELDRCRPTYAVQLLERVKHLFDVPGVVFVFATNSDQLQHSIAGAYGANFDGFRYLKRFFDRTYVFAAPATSQYVEHLCSTLPKGKLRAPEDNIALALAKGCEAYKFDLRAIAQVLEMVDATATAWTHKIRADIVFLFPLCAHFYLTGKAEWPDAQSAEINKWVYSRTRQQRDQTIDASIRYNVSYRIGLSMFRNLQEIERWDNRGDSNGADGEYLRLTFRPELTSDRIANGTHSIQTELLGLVANAGRMVTSGEQRSERDEA